MIGLIGICSHKGQLVIRAQAKSTNLLLLLNLAVHTFRVLDVLDHDLADLQGCVPKPLLERFHFGKL